MNNIYYALFINADGSDEGMLTPNQLVGIFDQEHLQSILRRELMLGHIHGELLSYDETKEYPPDTYMVETLNKLDTSNVWFTMVTPNTEDFDSNDGMFINVNGMNDEDKEALVAMLLKQGADEAEVRRAIAQAERNTTASVDYDKDEQEQSANPDEPSAYSKALVEAARNLLIASGIDYYEFHGGSKE